MKTYTAQVNVEREIEEDGFLYHHGGDNFIIDGRHYGAGETAEVKKGQKITSRGQATVATQPLGSQNGASPAAASEPSATPIRTTESGTAMIVDKATQAPGCCVFTADDEGPFIDFNRWIPYMDPRGYMSVKYFKEVARDLFDLVEAEEVESLKAELEECRQMKEDPEAFAAAVVAGMNEQKESN